MKKSGKTNGWSKRWFVLNEKNGKVSILLYCSQTEHFQLCLVLCLVIFIYITFDICGFIFVLSFFYSLHTQKGKRKDIFGVLSSWRCVLLLLWVFMKMWLFMFFLPQISPLLQRSQPLHCIQWVHLWQNLSHSLTPLMRLHSSQYDNELTI